MFEVKNCSITDAFQSKFHLILYGFKKNSTYNFKEPRFSLEKS